MNQSLQYLLDTDTCIYLLNGNAQIKCTQINLSGCFALAFYLIKQLIKREQT